MSNSRIQYLVFLSLPVLAGCQSSTVQTFVQRFDAQIDADSQPIARLAVGGGAELDSFKLLVPSKLRFDVLYETVDYGAVLDGIAVAWGMKPLTDLDGTELLVGQSFTVEGSVLVGETAPTRSRTFTYAVERYGAPQLPAHPEWDNWTTQPFLTIRIATIDGGTPDIEGTVSFSLAKVTTAEESRFDITR